MLRRGPSNLPFAACAKSFNGRTRGQRAKVGNTQGMVELLLRQAAHAL